MFRYNKEAIMSDIIIKIKNNYNSIRCFDLITPYNIDKNIEIDIDIEIEIENSGEKIKEDYYNFLQKIRCSPLVVNVDSNANSQLEFYMVNLFGKLNKIIPQLNLDGSRRCSFGYVQMEDCDWNIADTKESFILAFNTLIKVNLRPNQEILLFFSLENQKIIKNVQFNK